MHNEDVDVFQIIFFDDDFDQYSVTKQNFAMSEGCLIKIIKPFKIKLSLF